MLRRNEFKAYLAGERGAITVDWTVLTTGAVGLSLAMVGVLSGVLGNVSDEVNQELFAMKADEGAYGFDFGAPEWEGAEATFVDGFGYVLGPIAGSGGLPAVSTSYDLPEGLATATLTFDVLAFDSLDGEDFVIYVEGYEVGRITSGSEITYTASPLEGVSISIDFDVSILEEGDDLGGYRNRENENDWWWHDGAAMVTVTVDDPDTKLDVAFGSTADGEIEDESWGVDNIGVTGSWTREVRDTSSADAYAAVTTDDTTNDTSSGGSESASNGNSGRNDGWGNGDQDAPGNSLENNNAENSDRCHQVHGCANAG